MHTQFDQGRLISTMAFALRHDPDRFGLDLDDKGWTSFEDLIIAIRFERYDWALIDESFVRATIAGMDRFEIRDARILAVYGHSVELAKPPAVVTPPALLFHGTAADNVSSILQQGILRMRRRFAHFSTDYQWVVQFPRMWRRLPESQQPRLVGRFDGSPVSSCSFPGLPVQRRPFLISVQTARQHTRHAESTESCVPQSQR